jgi:hypothetical protein
MMGLMLRRRVVASAMGAAVALTFCAGGVGGVAGAQPVAHAARRHVHTINVTENANLYLVKKSGSVLNERGTATGTLHGSVTARFVTSIVQVTGTVTIYPSKGSSLTITVLGYPRSTGTVAKFTGSMSVKSGTGRYAHAKGSGAFSGTVNRKTWASTVHATAKLTY